VARLAPSGALSSRLDVLAEGPTPAEASSGLRSALPGPEAVTSVDLSGGVARVDLSRDFTELSGSDQLLAIAQMVFTLTERADVARVGFTLDGEPVQVPRGDGTLTSDPVARADYGDLT
jgi:spore germination protein GerM